MLCRELINKILLYNIHPIAELLKPVIRYKNKFPESDMFNLSYFGCKFCHKLICQPRFNLPKVRKILFCCKECKVDQ